MLTSRRAHPPGSAVTLWTAGDGWPLRRFDWPVPEGARRGSLLLLNGRADMFEKYLEVFAHFHARGWAVTSFDWRGQGGSGRLSDDPHVGHIGDFSVWIADLAALAGQWGKATAGPHVIIGHSMGGHLLLRALAQDAVRPDAAVLVAPMLGFNSGLLPAWLGACIARAMCRLGDPARAAWRNSEKPGACPSDRQRTLTHSLDRYEDELYWWEQDGLKLGPPSWKWMDAAYRSAAMLDAPDMLERIATPLLLLAAERDALVSIGAIRRAVRRIAGSRLHVYGDESAHEILREADPVRRDALARIDAFLDEAAPAR